MKAQLLSTILTMATIVSVNSTTAFAKGPDGVTPANEGVCDVLLEDGVTKGLYGMCVAYCEAQDLADPSEPITPAEFEALPEAKGPNGKILRNYLKKMKDTDPHMPCIKVEEPCPCFDDADLQSLDGYSASGLPASTFQCVEGDYSDAFNYNTYEYTYIQEYNYYSYPYTNQFNNYAIVADLDYNYYSYDVKYCAFQEYDGANGTYNYTYLDESGGLTDEQFNACRQKLRDYAPISGCTQYSYP